MQTSADAIYLARHVGLRAGLPIGVPALTVNRLCGSGLQAILSAAQSLALGSATYALAGGTENMSQAPHVVRGARKGFHLGQNVAFEDSLMDRADRFVRRHADGDHGGESREEVRRYARGMRRVRACEPRARARRRKATVILPKRSRRSQIPGPKGTTITVDRDEGPRARPDDGEAREAGGAFR